LSGFTRKLIGKKTQDCAAVREALAGTQLAMEDELAAIKMKYLQRIRVKESVAKTAVYDLSTADPERLGVRIEGAGDVVTIEDAAGGLDKWLDAMLAEEPEEMQR